MAPGAPGSAERAGPLRALGLLGLYLKVGALNELQYRSNFAMQIFQSMIALLTRLVTATEAKTGRKLLVSHEPILKKKKP